LGLVKPDHLFMGQKDYQQCLVVTRLIQLIRIPVFSISYQLFGNQTDGSKQPCRRLTSDQRKRSRHFTLQDIAGSVPEIPVGFGTGTTKARSGSF
jgi:pantoate--beta-alanine ligase